MPGTPKRILLLEPGYKNKYPPLGLMKLSAYHRARGDRVRFAKHGIDDTGDSGPLFPEWDRVYVTTLFSFEWNRAAHAIDHAITLTGNRPERVFVGGIAASLMPDAFAAESRWSGVRFVRGILDQAPAASLGLTLGHNGDFGAEDLAGGPIDEMVPDYGLLEDTTYQYPVNDAYFGYASRGCVRKCSFCGVPKLEGAQRDMPPLTTLLRGVEAAYGAKKDLILMDNNITASGRYREVIAEIRDLGFLPGAKLKRNGGRGVARRVDFNQGVDARILAKTPMFLREMASICISPLRIAFDHVGMRKVYETAVRSAADAGLSKMSNYMLYNFMDSPADLYARMRLNIDLNEALGIRIWSFPMRYQPLELKDRSHVGKRWNRYFLRSFQVMLQATHGVVSGDPSFFDHAYGADPDAFARLLSMPQAFLFHRDHYANGPGQPFFDEYQAARARLSQGQEDELLERLSGGSLKPTRQYFRDLTRRLDVAPALREVLRFHTLDTHHRLSAGADFPSDPRRSWEMPPEEEHIEDAGLFDRV